MIASNRINLISYTLGLCLSRPQKEIDSIFRRMLMEGASAKQQAAPLTAAALVRLPRWKKLEPLIKSFLGNTLHLLGKGP